MATGSSHAKKIRYNVEGQGHKKSHSHFTIVNVLLLMAWVCMSI